MHIAIEGMDGVGKTTAARALAARLGFQLVEKPLQYLLDEQGQASTYLRVRDHINDQTDNDALRAWFYGLGNLYLLHRFHDENIITDRHLASNYFWCGSPMTENLFRCLVEITGKPDHTFLLFTTTEEAMRRIRRRNPDDPDLRKAELQTASVKKVRAFLDRYEMRYTSIDTTHLGPEAVVEVMIRGLQESAVGDEQR